MGRYAGLAVLLLLGGCATVPAPPSPHSSPRFNVNQQLLDEEQGGGAAGAVEPYRLAPTETFRMPVPVRATEPALPHAYAERTLPLTTLCVRVIVDADGGVQRTEPLLSHSRCGDGALQQHADLLQAALLATSQWRYTPAALCRFAAGRPALAPGDCSGATSVEPVPVTLAYAFTFEVAQGRVSVRMSGQLR